MNDFTIMKEDGEPICSYAKSDGYIIFSKGYKLLKGNNLKFPERDGKVYEKTKEVKTKE